MKHIKTIRRHTLGIADKLRGAMNADDFRDYMLSFLFLRYLSDNYEAAAKKELGSDYLQCEEEIKITIAANQDDVINALKEQIKTILINSNWIARKNSVIEEHEVLLESKR